MKIMTENLKLVQATVQSALAEQNLTKDWDQIKRKALFDR